MVSIRNTCKGDGDLLIAEMRESDRIECLSYGADDIAPGVHRSIKESALCWTAEDDDGIVCIFGCGAVQRGIGSPWMLGTDRLLRYQRELLKITPDFIDIMLGVYPRLMNFVHTRNTTSVRWLRRLGFTIHDPVRYGDRGELFHPFDMQAG